MEQDKAMEQPPFMILNIILDASGSMECRKVQTISGLNEYIKGCKEDYKDERVLASVVKFGGSPSSAVELQDLQKINELTDKDYITGGSTALLDAVGYCVEKVESITEDKKWRPAILCVVVTDGEENASKKYSRDTIRQIINEKESQGNWTFVYLGVELDAWKTGMNTGFVGTNSARYDGNNMIGMCQTLRAQTKQLADGISDGVMRTNEFFAKK